MSANLPQLGVLLWPSIRSLAYACVFRELDLWPNEVIWLENSIENLPGLRHEAIRFHYEAFFDVSQDLLELVRKNAVAFHRPGTADINSPQVLHLISRCQTENFVFTGGGILRRELLGLGKRFIHVHPGIIPEYRGSTCFYYSLLKDFSLGTTAFFMGEQIDAGDIMIQTRFRLNYLIRPDQPLFMDYVLDPYIRATTLKSVLNKLASSESIATWREDCETPFCYVMHPLLRHLTIHRINREFDPKQPIGIFEMANSDRRGTGWQV
ncbi:MAG: hypothetical protein HY675_05270 [Chloroflexi bacterium]|nr:hypothetical protein [Chloroflexota bacterium]